MSRQKPSTPPTSGSFAYSGLDRVLHEKARLGILTALLTHPAGLLFNTLKDCCVLTDGNLSRHTQVLQDAGLVEIWKGYEGKRPQTLVRLSKTGRREFLAYLGELAKNTPSAANIAAYAGIVRERAVLRGLIRVGTDIAGSGFNTEGRDAAQLLDQAEQRVFDIDRQVET